MTTDTKPPLHIVTDDPGVPDTPDLDDNSFIFHSITHLRITPEKQQKLEIQEHIVTHGTPPQEFPPFSAPINVSIGQDFHGQTIIARGEVPLNVGSIAEAFDLLPTAVAEVAPKIKAEARKQMARQKLAIPGTPLIDRFKHNGQDFRVGPG